MTKVDHQLAILELARKEGIDLNRASEATYRRLALKVRTLAEKGADIGRASTSMVATTIRLRVVNNEIAKENEEICRKNECGKFRLLEDKKHRQEVPACDACNCSGKWLRSKWKDAKEKCPIGRWDNRRKKFTIVEEEQEPDSGPSVGDATSGGP